MISSIWNPQPKQTIALTCPAYELFYGGAAGGGKSDFLLADYLQGVQKYEKRWIGILFRQTYDELEELISRAEELYCPLGAVFKASGKYHNEFFFPNGATLKLRYLEKKKDVKHYQGHQYSWVAFDELPNFDSDYCYRYMILRNRSPFGAPCFIRSTGNPGGPGHAWTKHRFIDYAPPYTIVRDPETTMTRCFIPSTLDDNLIMMRKDPNYENRMKLAPPQLFRAMRYGDWDISAGAVFEEFHRAKHVMKPQTLGPEWFKFCSMDWGYAKPFSIGWWAVNGEGRMIRYRELYGCDPEEDDCGVRRGALEVAQEAWNISAPEGVSTMVADPACWSHNDDSLSIAEKFESAGWEMIKGNNDRVNGLAMMHQLMITMLEDGYPMLRVFETCYAWIRTIPTLMPSPTKPEDVDTRMEDHPFDESKYAILSEFARNPTDALRQAHGKWNLAKKKDDYDDLRAGL